MLSSEEDVIALVQRQLQLHDGRTSFSRRYGTFLWRILLAFRRAEVLTHKEYSEIEKILHPPVGGDRDTVRGHKADSIVVDEFRDYLCVLHIKGGRGD